MRYIKRNLLKQRESQGKLLARKIEVLRSLRLDEQRKLQQWRDVSMVEIQKSISDEIRKSVDLKEENKQLLQQRENLLKPVDLTKAWEKVEKEKQSLKVKSDKLIEDRRFLLSFKRELKSLEKELNARDTRLAKLAITAQAIVKETKEAHALALSLKEEAHTVQKKSIREAKSKTIELKNRETVVAGKERDIKIEHADIKRKRKELKDIQTHIRSQQDTMRTAYENIKRYER